MCCMSGAKLDALPLAYQMCGKLHGSAFCNSSEPKLVKAFNQINVHDSLLTAAIILDPRVKTPP